MSFVSEEIVEIENFELVDFINKDVIVITVDIINVMQEVIVGVTSIEDGVSQSLQKTAINVNLKNFTAD